jgi:FtsZ-binding cell division protein ZapB
MLMNKDEVYTIHTANVMVRDYNNHFVSISEVIGTLTKRIEQLEAKINLANDDVGTAIETGEELLDDKNRLYFEKQQLTLANHNLSEEIKKLKDNNRHLIFALKRIVSLPLGPDRGSAQWQIDCAVSIASKAIDDHY